MRPSGFALGAEKPLEGISLVSIASCKFCFSLSKVVRKAKSRAAAKSLYFFITTWVISAAASSAAAPATRADEVMETPLSGCVFRRYEDGGDGVSIAFSATASTASSSSASSAAAPASSASSAASSASSASSASFTAATVAKLNCRKFNKISLNGSTFATPLLSRITPPLFILPARAINECKSLAALKDMSSTPFHLLNKFWFPTKNLLNSRKYLILVKIFFILLVIFKVLFKINIWCAQCQQFLRIFLKVFSFIRRLIIFCMLAITGFINFK